MHNENSRVFHASSAGLLHQWGHLEIFEGAGVDPALVTMLRTALDSREEMEIRWSRA